MWWSMEEVLPVSEIESWTSRLETGFDVVEIRTKGVVTA
jgi:hypothetical protein